MGGESAVTSPALSSSGISWASGEESGHSESPSPSSSPSSSPTSSPSTSSTTQSTLPLRSIHSRLQLETTRAAFWELLAKQALRRVPAVAAADSAGRHTRTSQATAPVRHPEVHPEVPTLEEMATQMNELGAGLEALKEKAAADEATIGDLRRDLKRTDRLKSSYKRQVGELTSMLEEKGRVGSRVLSNQDESAALQRRVAEMRVQVEGLRRERDTLKAQSRVAEGRFEELKGRFSRREQALLSAQRRCRELEAAAEQGGVTCEAVVQAVDAGTCMDVEDGVEEYVEVMDISSGSSEEEGREDGAEDAVVLKDDDADDDADDAADDDDADDADGDDDDDGHAVESHQHFISTTSPLYVKIFGPSADLAAAADVLISADEALARCAGRIAELNRELDALRDESHQLKSQCADQYDRVFKYKSMSTSLAAKVKTLEAHVASVQHSAAEYQRQMEELVSRQRANAAEESYKLSSEIQFMSTEQARLLLKLHEVQLCLDKSRAMSAEMERRCEALEGRLRAMQGARADVDSGSLGAPGPDPGSSGGGGGGDTIQHHLQNIGTGQFKTL